MDWTDILLIVWVCVREVLKSQAFDEIRQPLLKVVLLTV